MHTRPYATSPDPNQTHWPKGVRYIVGNEGCERFSYYGMSAILYIYVVSLYLGQHIQNDEAANLATSTVHLFSTGVYAFPMIGAIIADRLLGKYHTILWLSLVYCAGHAVLSLTEGSTPGLYAGLMLIAIGSGGIKPCVSAHVGDQFGPSNWRLLEKVYQLFYFIINFGSFFATLLIPLMQKWFGWRVAFAIPGVLMFIATCVFWMGRHEFVHVPARPGGKLGLLDSLSSIFLFMTFGSLFFTATKSGWVIGVVSVSCLMAGLWIFQVRQSLSADDGFLAVSFYAVKEWFKELWLKAAEPFLATAKISSNTGESGGYGGFSWRTSLGTRFSNEAIDGTVAVLRIVSVFAMVSVFWSLFDQHGSSWIRQAEMMERHVTLPFLGNVEILASQIQSLNPIIVMLLIPLLSYGVFPLLSRRGIKFSLTQKMSAGMIIASSSFVAVALIQRHIDAGEHVHVMWQLLPYGLITLAEVLVSATGLEFAYSQAPKRMKSTVMGFWLLSVALGNILVALTARFSHLSLVNFFWLFAGLMGLSALLFSARVFFYVPRDYPQ